MRWTFKSWWHSVTFLDFSGKPVMVCKPGGQNFADVCHTQMGIKSQAMISIWICPLLGQCFTQDKGEEDFQGGYGYRQRVWSNLWQTLLPRDTRACYRTEPFCLSSWSRVDFFFLIKLTARECFTCLTGSYYSVQTWVRSFFTLLGVEGGDSQEEMMSPGVTAWVGTSQFGFRHFVLPQSLLDIDMAACS